MDSSPKHEIGRNDPCWCCSGKKYKRCHWDLDNAPPKRLWEDAAETRKILADANYCTHAEAGSTTCSGQIVRAHALPKGAALAVIAESGHVYGPDPDLMSIDKHDGVVPFKRVGVNKASTFTGFCALHDDRTFAPLEKQALTLNSEQCFLMSYRAICREFYQRQIDSTNIRVMRGPDQEWPQMIQGAIAGIRMRLDEVQRHKNVYDEMLGKNNFEAYRTLIIRFKCVPDVLATGAFFPEYDFSGNQCQNLSGNPPFKNIAVTLLPADGGGVAVVGWQPESDNVCIPFAHSLMSIEQEILGNAVVRLVFQHIENTFFRISWWDQLSEGTRQSLVRRANTMGSRQPDCLSDDKIRYVSWPVISVETHFG